MIEVISYHQKTVTPDRLTNKKITWRIPGSNVGPGL